MSRTPKSILGIELTEARARVVELHQAGNRLRRGGQLEVSFAECGDDPAAHGAALRAALDAAGLKTRGAAVSLPRHLIILRELTLPAAEPDALRQMAQLKVERELPFPAAEMALGLRRLDPEEAAVAVDPMDSAPVPGTRAAAQPATPVAAQPAAETLRVLAGFVKREFLERQLAVLEAAGLEAHAVGVSALYSIRAFQGSVHFDPGKPQGLVSIGSRMTEIAVTNGSQSLLSRSASIGLERVDLVGGDAATPDNRQFLDEVGRTFTSFHGGTDPIRSIVLADRGAGADGIEALLKQRFDVPISRLRPFDSTTLETAETFDDDHLYAAALGAALSRLDGGESIDFLPPQRSWLERLKWTPQTAWITAAVVAAIALFIVPPIYLGKLQHQLDLQTELSQGLDAAGKALGEYRQKVETVTPWTNQRSNWVVALGQLARPEVTDRKRVHLTSLRMQAGGNMTVVGRARSHDDCRRLEESYNRQPGFSARLLGTNQGKAGEAFGTTFTMKLSIDFAALPPARNP